MLKALLIAVPGVFHGLYFALFLLRTTMRLCFDGATIAEAVVIGACVRLFGLVAPRACGGQVSAGVLLATGMFLFFLRLKIPALTLGVNPSVSAGRLLDT
jgi:hypothetical protein